jgi:hypothetical protein
MNAEEARNRLLQAYGEKVTIRRTLPRTSRNGGLQAAEEKYDDWTAGFLVRFSERQPYGVAIGCAAGAGEEAGDV